MTIVTQALAALPAMEPAMRRILVLTDYMLAHAEDGDWDQLAVVEKSRRQLMSHYFGEEIAPDKRTPVVADAIRIILRADQEIARQVEAGKQRLANDFRQLSTHQHASNVYQNSTT